MSDQRRMTDADFMYSILSDGEWHKQMEIINESNRIRGCGLTPHSRASDLRRRGFLVQNAQHVGEDGRRVSEYRLGGLDEAAVSPVDAAGPAASPNDTVREAQDIDGLRQPASLGSSPTPGTVPSETGISSHGGEAGSDPQLPPHQPSLFEAAA